MENTNLGKISMSEQEGLKGRFESELGLEPSSLDVQCSFPSATLSRPSKLDQGGGCMVLFRPWIN